MKFLKHLLMILSGIALAMLTLWYFVTAPVLSEPPQSYTNNVDIEALKRHVRYLSEEAPERSIDLDKLKVSADYIYKEFSKHTQNVSYQEYDVWGLPYTNFIAKFGNLNSKEVLVIGAHYDAYDGLPGADDNASGVAGLLELARLISRQSFDYQIQLAAYTLEEPPHFRTTDMGSYHHAKWLHENSYDVKLMISLEMIGYFSDAPNSQTFPIPIMEWFYPTTGNFIGVVSNFSNFSQTRELKRVMTEATPLPVYSINAPAFVPGIDFSDHLSFWEFGYPAVMVTDTAFYRNMNYHTEADTWRTLDYKAMADVVSSVAKFIEM